MPRRVVAPWQGNVSSESREERQDLFDEVREYGSDFGIVLQ